MTGSCSRAVLARTPLPCPRSANLVPRPSWTARRNERSQEAVSACVCERERERERGREGERERSDEERDRDTDNERREREGERGAPAWGQDQAVARVPGSCFKAAGVKVSGNDLAHKTVRVDSHGWKLIRSQLAGLRFSRP